MLVNTSCKLMLVECECEWLDNVNGWTTPRLSLRPTNRPTNHHNVHNKPFLTLLGTGWCCLYSLKGLAILSLESQSSRGRTTWMDGRHLDSACDQPTDPPSNPPTTTTNPFEPCSASGWYLYSLSFESTSLGYIYGFVRIEHVSCKVSHLVVGQLEMGDALTQPATNCRSQPTCINNTLWARNMANWQDDTIVKAI